MLKVKPLGESTEFSLKPTIRAEMVLFNFVAVILLGIIYYTLTIDIFLASVAIAIVIFFSLHGVYYKQEQKLNIAIYHYFMEYYAIKET